MTYIIKQESFEGPLNLLLELIQEQKLSINEISLAQVTDEFVSFFKKLEENDQANQETLAEFLVIAATLLLIKSRSLLPQLAVNPEEEASIQELEDRLKEYQRLKEIASVIGQMARLGPKSFSRQAYAAIQPVFRPPKNVTSAIIQKAFGAVIQAMPKIEKLAEEKIKKIISLEEKIKELQNFLQKKVERAFSELISGAKEKVEVIVSFLALLELAKQKLVSVEQKGLFDDIKIRKIVQRRHASKKF